MTEPENMRDAVLRVADVVLYADSVADVHGLSVADDGILAGVGMSYGVGSAWQASVITDLLRVLDSAATREQVLAHAGERAVMLMLDELTGAVGLVALLAQTLARIQGVTLGDVVRSAVLPLSAEGGGHVG